MKVEQPDLFQQQRREILVAGWETLPAIAGIEAAGGRITMIERVTGRNAEWRLRVVWPEKSQRPDFRRFGDNN